MNRFKIIIIAILTAGFVISCNSPTDIDTPHEETPLGKVNAYLSEFNVEQYGKIYTFKADDYKFFVNLNNEPNRLWVDINLDSYENPVDEVLRVAMKKMSIHLDSVELANGKIAILEDTLNYIGLELYRWKNPLALETKFDIKSLSTLSEMSYEIDKMRKTIKLNFDIKITDIIVRTEVNDDGYGGKIFFESTESKLIPVKVALVLKYI